MTAITISSICKNYIVAFDSTATSVLTFFIKPCNTFPGPNSVKLSKPSAIILRTLCVQRTGAVSCAIRFCLISSGAVCGAASTF